LVAGTDRLAVSSRAQVACEIRGVGPLCGSARGFYDLFHLGTVGGPNQQPVSLDETTGGEEAGVVGGEQFDAQPRLAAGTGNELGLDPVSADVDVLEVFHAAQRYTIGACSGSTT
jgi:hypothetical protein